MFNLICLLCLTTLRKFIHEQTELDYLYSSLKEGTFIKYCGIFTVFTADFILVWHDTLTL